jgi:hypothetical protein
MVFGVTDWSINGTSLRTRGYNIEVVDGWDQFPARRGGSIGVAHRHGSFVNPRRTSEPRIITLAVRVLPVDATTGLVSTTGPEHLQENLDIVLGLLWGSAELLISRVMPDASTREINAEVLSAVDATATPTSTRLLIVELECAYPFWHETPIIADDGNSGAFTLTNNGNAPIGDAVVTFSGISKLTHDDTGDFIEITAGAGVVVDVGARTILDGATPVDNDFLTNSPWWIEIAPGLNNFTLTGAGTVDIDYFDSWL